MPEQTKELVDLFTIATEEYQKAVYALGRQLREDKEFLSQVLFLYERNIAGLLERSDAYVRSIELSFGIPIDFIFRIIEFHYKTIAIHNIKGNTDIEEITLGGIKITQETIEEHKDTHLRNVFGGVDNLTLRNQGVDLQYYGSMKESIKASKKRAKRSGKPVLMLELHNKTPLVRFNSIKEAAEFSGLKESNIIKVCKGTAKSAGGYFWSYLIDVENTSGEEESRIFYSGYSQYDPQDHDKFFPKKAVKKEDKGDKDEIAL